MIFSDIAVLDESGDVKPHMWVGVEGDTITYYDSVKPHDMSVFGEVYDGQNKVLMSGFYNTHTHSPMTLLRGYAENLPLQRWLNESVFPFEAKMTPEDSYWGTLLAIAEMVRYGTVSMSDMYFHTDARVRAVLESGFKANICNSVVAIPDGEFNEHPECISYEKFLDTITDTGNGRLKFDYNLHAEYTSGPHIARQVIEHAIDRNACIHIHISETQLEHEECKQRHNGLTPVQYFESLGAFNIPVIAAHCVWVDEDDMDIMAANGAFVATNPVSNLKLGSGFAPIARMMEKGVNVSLGTDGTASNNNLDILQDLYVMTLLPKGLTGNPCAVTPFEALTAVTRTGALAQGREDCGLIRVGMKADLTVLDTSGPSWQPQTDILNNIVYAGHGNDVCFTMIDGQVMYRDGEWPTLDYERIVHEVSMRTSRIISEL